MLNYENFKKNISPFSSLFPSLVGGDFPMTITKVNAHLGNGVFAGEGKMPINWIFEADFAMEFDNLQINTDYRQIGGSARMQYNASKTHIADLDAFDQGGVVNNTRNGIILPDLECDFAIPENPVFEYNAETNELLVFSTDGQAAGSVEMPNNDGKTVFPVIVKDSEGNLYRVDLDDDRNVVTENIDKNEPEELGDAGTDETAQENIVGCGCPTDKIQSWFNGDCDDIFKNLQKIKTANENKEQVTLYKHTSLATLKGRISIDSLCIPELWYDMSFMKTNEVIFDPSKYTVKKLTANDNRVFWSIYYENNLALKIPESENDAEKKIRALEKWLIEGGEDEEIYLDHVQWYGQFNEIFKTRLAQV